LRSKTESGLLPSGDTKLSTSIPSNIFARQMLQ
jgi:hypothetical protein